MGVNSLPKTVTRQHRRCDLNPGPSAPESSTLTILALAQSKIDKYSKLASTHIFYSFAIETAGTWHEMAIELTQKIGKHVTPLSQKIPGRQRSFSNAFPWLCK